MIAHILPLWFWHPLGQCAGTTAEVARCKSYNFWSGIVSDIGEVTLIFGAAMATWKLYKHFQCHVESPKNCWRIGHRVPGTSLFACGEHHPHGQERGTGITAAEIRRHHEDSKV